MCGRAVSGLCRSVRGPPGGRGPASPHKSAGVGRAALAWLWAALRGWAALACLRASRSPLIPPHFAGPPVGPAAGWAAPSVSAAAPWFVGFCMPAAASPRPPPWAGAKGRIAPPPTGVRNSAACGQRWKTGPHGGPGGLVLVWLCLLIEHVPIHLIGMKQHMVCASRRHHKMMYKKLESVQY